jgi:YVTN family beta-propeller protein
LAIRTEQPITQGISEPFIGPRSFTLIEKDIFFGRDAETQKIVSLILSNQEILIYAQSGAGKTSIINTKVLPELKTYEMQLLPTARVRGAIEHGEAHADIKNIYIFNTLQYLDPEIDTNVASDNKLTDFLSKYPKKRSSTNSESPRIIIFDQFEEIFTTYVKDWPNQRQEFFQQLRDALTTDPLLKVVFIIREEYLAQLDKYTSILPDRLRIRFHLEPLRKLAALSAVEGPLIRFGHSEVAHQVAERIVDDLLKTQVEDVFGSIVETSGEYVEPVYLQVVSQRLWRKGLPADQKSISKTALGNVNEALEEFFTDAVKSTAKQTGVNEGNIRDWCEKKLITSTGTRGIVHREAALTGGISNHVIDLLEQKYLVRREQRAGASWYELTHDRLLKPIRDSNKKWKEIKRKKRLKLAIPVIGAISIILISMSLYLFPVVPPESTSPTSTLTTFNVGASASIAVNSINNFVYATNNIPSDTNNIPSYSISVIDGCNCPGRSYNQIVSQITIGFSPTSVSVNPNTSKVYVAGYNIISVIDPITKKPVSTNSVGIGISSLAVNPNTNTLYIADYISNSIYVMNGTTNKVVSQIPIDSPTSISVNPNTNKVYAVGSNFFSVIDGTTNKVVYQAVIGRSLSSVSVNPNTNTLYIADSRSNATYAMNGTTNKILSRIPVGLTPSSVSVNTNNSLVNVANTKSNSISVIDGTTNEVVSTMSVGIGPSFLAVNPNTNTVYLASFNHPPIVGDQVVTTSMDKPLTIIIKAVDQDPDDLTGTIGLSPKHGQLSPINQANGSLTYTPESGFTGSDVFGFTVNDGKEESNIGLVQIRVK